MGVDNIRRVLYEYLRTYLNKLLKCINMLCIIFRINRCIYYREKISGFK